MSWATLRPITKERLLSVEGVGQVHDYIRHTAFWVEFLKRHVSEGQVNTWEFTRSSLQNAQDAVGDREAVGCVYRATHQIQIIGRLSVSERPDDGTEHSFQDTADRVVALFLADQLFGGSLLVPNPPQIQSIGHQSYGGVLVHQAIITMAATERVGGA